MHDCKYDNNIILSFKYSVKTKDYTIEKITKKSKEKCNDIIYELYEKFKELSNMNLLDFQNKPKSTGYEMLPLYELNVSIDEEMKRELELANDSKIIVFRFYKQKCRLLLVQSKKCPSLLYVIGYDWNYSAYKH
jgi:DNA-directed RNA polymerase beta' subunit